MYLLDMLMKTKEELLALTKEQIIAEPTELAKQLAQLLDTLSDEYAIACQLHAMAQHEMLTQVKPKRYE